MNEITVHLVGNVATDPTTRTTRSGRPVTRFRLASTPRRFEPERGWQDQPTSYVTVICWSSLAEHASVCVRRGDPVVLVGRLRVREWEQEGRKGSEVEVEAVGLGHDLHHGISIYKKLARSRPVEATVVADPGDEPVDPDDLPPPQPGTAPIGAPGGDRLDEPLDEPLDDQLDDPGDDPVLAGAGSPASSGADRGDAAGPRAA